MGVFAARGAAMPRTVRLLLVARAVNRLGAFSVPFLTVLISEDYGAGVTTAGLVAAGFGLASIPSRLAGARFADVIGPRRTIVLGMVGCAVAQLGIALSHSLVAVGAFAVLLGLAYELYEPPSQAMIADSVAQHERVRAYSLLNAALAVGGMGAGLIAAAVGRWDLRWLFVVDAVSCLACALLVGRALPADPPRDADTARPSADTRVRPWHDRALLLMLACGTVYALVYLQVVMALPLALEIRGMAAADAGWLFTASALTVVASQPLVRVPRFAALPNPAALALGYLLSAAGLTGLAAAHSLAASVGAVVVWSVGELIVLGRAYALVADLAPPGATGRYLAVFGISWGIAGVAAPVVGTQLLDRSGPAALWAGTAAVCVMLAAVQPYAARVLCTRRASAAPDAVTRAVGVRDAAAQPAE
ncbi:MFS transporter [Yinghuangia seranimata]|uniref:MFS transporter n=1 Tax=Yinghuangia seranimata TaxID=408067 RepID=UPI00248B1ABE|nr:MFS transporter [Yinghuangia seranimata]MDI2124576.1 MFS transporter [Yinghuangia seranimata]